MFKKDPTQPWRNSMSHNPYSKTDGNYDRYGIPAGY